MKRTLQQVAAHLAMFLQGGSEADQEGTRAHGRRRSSFKRTDMWDNKREALTRDQRRLLGVAISMAHAAGVIEDSEREVGRTAAQGLPAAARPGHQAESRHPDPLSQAVAHARTSGRSVGTASIERERGACGPDASRRRSDPRRGPGGQAHGQRPACAISSTVATIPTCSASTARLTRCISGSGLATPSELTTTA